MTISLANLLFISVLTSLLSASLVTSSGDANTYAWPAVPYHFSCEKGGNGFSGAVCDLGWDIPAAYALTDGTVLGSFAVYDYDSLTPVGVYDRQNYAVSWAEALIAVSHEDSENGRPYPKLCDLAIERFTCLGVFPLCAAVEVPVAPFPTCDHACLQLQALCGPKVGQIVACGQSAQGVSTADGERVHVFPDESCSIDMAKEYFIPDMEGYDYEDHIADYTTLYIVLAVVWSLLAVGWYGSGYNINGSMVSSLPLSQSLSPLPAVKAAACMLGCGLWSSCGNWYMCSLWLHQAFVNVHLVYETCLIVSFMTIAKGWSLTRTALRPNEWKRILCFGITFYITNSVLVVGKKAFMSSKQFFIASLVVYGTAYAIVLHNTIIQVLFLSPTITSVARSIGADNDDDNGVARNYTSRIKAGVMQKRNMLILFVLVVSVSFVTEISCQVAIGTSTNTFITTCVFEVTHLVVFCLLSTLYAPRDMNPFFFARVLKVSEGNEEEDNPLLSTVIVHDASGAGAGAPAGAGDDKGAADAGTTSPSSPRLIAGSGRIVSDDGDTDTRAGAGARARAGSGGGIGRRISVMFGMGRGSDGGDGGNERDSATMTTATTTTTISTGGGSGSSGVSGSQVPRPFLTDLLTLVRNPRAQERMPEDLVTSSTLAVMQDEFSGVYVALHKRSDAGVSIAAVRRGGDDAGAAGALWCGDGAHSSSSGGSRSSRRNNGIGGGSSSSSSGSNSIHSPAYLHTHSISHGDEVSIELTPSPTTVRPSRMTATPTTSTTNSSGDSGSGGGRVDAKGSPRNTSYTSSASNTSSNSGSRGRRRSSRREASSLPAPVAGAGAGAGASDGDGGGGGGGVGGGGSSARVNRDSFTSPRRLS